MTYPMIPYQILDGWLIVADDAMLRAHKISRIEAIFVAARNSLGFVSINLRLVGEEQVTLSFSAADERKRFVAILGQLSEGSPVPKTVTTKLADDATRFFD